MVAIVAVPLLQQDVPEISRGFYDSLTSTTQAWETFLVYSMVPTLRINPFHITLSDLWVFIVTFITAESTPDLTRGIICEIAFSKASKQLIQQ